MEFQAETRMGGEWALGKLRKERQMAISIAPELLRDIYMFRNNPERRRLAPCLDMRAKYALIG